MNSPMDIPSSQLTLKFLGGFTIALDGRPLTEFAYDKVRALLAYLVSETSLPHSRERLAEMLWPEARGEGARSNLRRTLHHLRKALASQPPVPEFFLSNKKDLAFNSLAPHWCDIAEFSRELPDCRNPAACQTCINQLESQLALYQGPFLNGLSLPDAPAFDNWLESRREALHRQALALLQKLASCHEKLGNPTRAIALAQRETILEPWAEEGHRRLMQLLAGNGQTAAALAQFESCRQLLEQELGLEPEPETRELARRLRQEKRPVPPPAILSTPLSERRQVCLLICELEPAQDQDPELFSTTLGNCHSACTEAINVHRGYGIPMHAGKILAYFGYPQAQENAPRETLEAALKIARQLTAFPDLRVRMAAHAGWVVNDQRFNLPDATGVISRQAGRLTEQTPWGEIAVSPEMVRLTEGYFLLTPRQSTPDAPMQFLRGSSGASHRLEAAAHRLTPLVGRRGEIRLLHRLWEKTRQGRRQALLIRGEPGIGKSRLVQALLRQVETSGGVWRKLRCHPEFQHTPYYPVIELLQRMLDRQLQETAPPSRRRQQLENWLGQAGSPLVPHLPAIAELLNLPADDFQPSLAPGEKKRLTENALIALLDTLAVQQPILLVLEDIHWADPSTREAMQRYLKEGRLPVFFLLTARPEFPPPPQLDTLVLESLPPRQAEQLARQSAGRTLLSEQALREILRRADGVPLYIEEMARTLGESVGENVPGTLWNLLAVRLDAVGEAKRLAQQAAAIGRHFQADLLAALWDGDSATLALGLEHLNQAGLILRGDRAHYSFKHALIRDAAYQTLPLSERKQIHGRLAGLLQGPFQALVADSPERLAQHLAAAGAPLEAAAAWLQAGRLAASRSANQEAVFHFESGLAQLPSQEQHPRAAPLELSLQAALGTTLVAMKGYGAEEAKARFARALELSRIVGDDAELFQVTWGLWLGGRSCTPEAFPLEFAQKLERIALASGDPGQAMQVHYAYGNNLFWLAHYATARRHLEAAVALGRTLPSQMLLDTYGEDTGISSLSFLSWIDWIEGHPDTALSNSETAVAAARQLGHAHTLGFALTFATVLRRHLDLPEETAVFAQELLERAQQHDLALWLAAAISIGGWAAAALGRREALGPIRQGVDGARRAMLVVEATFVSFLVDGLFRLGDLAESAALANAAVTLCQEKQDLYFLPEFLRLRGEALYGLPEADHKEAQTCLEAALALAREHQARALELRAASALCRHAADPATSTRARRVLENILTHYQEGQDTQDLRIAKALLN